LVNIASKALIVPALFAGFLAVDAAASPSSGNISPITAAAAEMPLRLAQSGDVEIYEFPATLLDRIPKLNEYRFLVIEDQIVIVEPRDRSIALVIDRS